jgi:hypothetical protein
MSIIGNLDPSMSDSFISNVVLSHFGQVDVAMIQSPSQAGTLTRRTART